MSKPPLATLPEPLRATPDALREDARALRRGAVANVIGYGAALLHPPLLILVVRGYGAESFGLYTAASGLLWVGLRLGLLGLDKGLLWWVARAPSSEAVIRSGLIWVTAASALTAAAFGWLLTPFIAHWARLEGVEAMLRAMSIALLPMCWTELLLCVGLAQRRIGAKVFVRDGLLPLSFVGFALLALSAGFHGPEGLATAFVASQVSSLLGAWLTLRRTLPARLWGRLEPLPIELVRYTRAAFASELLNTLYQRLDVLLMAALTDARTLGIWAAVMQLGNVVRTIRRSFDPIVMATFARIGALPDRQRLVQSFSHATRLIVTTQTPVLLFLMAFAAPLLALFGAGFDAGARAVLVLCVCWLLNGLLGLNGLVLAGFGRSDWILLDVAAANLVLAALLAEWVPRFGLVGAALAVGASYTLQCGLQAWQAYGVAGTWAYDGQVYRAFALSLLAIATLGTAERTLSHLGTPAAAVVAFSISMLTFALGLVWQRRHTTRSSDPAPSSPQLG